MGEIPTNSVEIFSAFTHMQLTNSSQDPFLYKTFVAFHGTDVVLIMKALSILEATGKVISGSANNFSNVFVMRCIRCDCSN